MQGSVEPKQVPSCSRNAIGMTKLALSRCWMILDDSHFLLFSSLWCETQKKKTKKYFHFYQLRCIWNKLQPRDGCLATLKSQHKKKSKAREMEDNNMSNLPENGTKTKAADNEVWVCLRDFKMRECDATRRVFLFTECLSKLFNQRLSIFLSAANDFFYRPRWNRWIFARKSRHDEAWWWLSLFFFLFE